MDRSEPWLIGQARAHEHEPDHLRHFAARAPTCVGMNGPAASTAEDHRGRLTRSTYEGPSGIRVHRSRRRARREV